MNCLCKCNKTRYQVKKYKIETYCKSEIICSFCGCYKWDDSPNGLRTKLTSYLNKLGEKGFYLEVGAADGISQSNTYNLERLGNWTGILIEPDIDIYKLCRKNRPNNFIYNCALVSASYNNKYISFTPNVCPLMTNISNKIDSVDKKTVEAKTLNSILKEHNRNLDFCSIDVEGYELNLLNGLNLEKYRPRLICIEITYNKTEIFKIMKQNDYKLIDQIGHDYIFCPKDMTQYFFNLHP